MISICNRRCYPDPGKGQCSAWLLYLAAICLTHHMELQRGDRTENIFFRFYIAYMYTKTLNMYEHDIFTKLHFIF